MILCEAVSNAFIFSKLQQMGKASPLLISMPISGVSGHVWGIFSPHILSGVSSAPSSSVGYLIPPHILTSVSSAPPMGKVGRDGEAGCESALCQGCWRGPASRQLAGDCCALQLSTLCLIISIRIPPINEAFLQLTIIFLCGWRVNVQNRRFCGPAYPRPFYLRPDLQPATKGGGERHSR